MTEIVAYVASLSVLQAGILASLVAGAAAGVGALPIFVVRDVSSRVRDVLLGGAAGLMLGATVFSLILPGMDAAEARGLPEAGATALIGAGMMGGAVLMWLIDWLVPHEHLIKDKPEAERNRIRGIWLFVLAISIHNIPEGLAVGVGFGGGDVGNGLALALAIFVQNLPEGFAVALAMMTLKYTALGAVGVALGTGVIETLGGIVGAGVVTVASALLPLALAGAAGAMLFVVSHEVIPETHRDGNETPATFGVVAGFVLMMLLDVALT
jgi:ZIP family zinc transporter